MRATSATEFTPRPADISGVLAGWDADGEHGPARLVDGDDGRPKLQVRVELGLLQMEIDGRPDGVATERTTLAVLRRGLAEHRPATDGAFAIADADAAELDREGRLYAKRYLAWFGLGQWNRVVRDARHHLAAIEFAIRHARREAPAVASLRRWLPYAAMMLARAEAAIAAQEGDVRGALRIINSAERRLKRHYRRFGVDGARLYRDSEEVTALRQVARRLRSRVPLSGRRRLRRELQQAVSREEYERAAVLRDQLAGRENAAPTAATS